MKYDDLITGMRQYGVSDDEICLHSLGISADKICENVIISPGWDIEKVIGLGNAEVLMESGPLFGFKIWNIKNNDLEMTYIKAGFGAPIIMDALLCLGVTPCKRIIFVSSVGALAKEMNIGDIVIPEYSVCGDGASRYLEINSFTKDLFGTKSYPDYALFEQLKQVTAKVCERSQVKWHIGKTFCTDTIFAQYPHIKNIIESGCNSIDMETAVAFKAAKLMGIPIAAIFNVSDNTLHNKPVISGMSQVEKDYRQVVRGKVMPEIICQLFKTM